MRKCLTAMAVAVFIAVFTLPCFTGCTWMGKKSGEAVETVKEAPQDFDKGYDQGQDEVKKAD